MTLFLGLETVQIVYTFGQLTTLCTYNNNSNEDDDENSNNKEEEEAISNKKSNVSFVSPAYNDIKFLSDGRLYVDDRKVVKIFSSGFCIEKFVRKSMYEFIKSFIHMGNNRSLFLYSQINITIFII